MALFDRFKKKAEEATEAAKGAAESVEAAAEEAVEAASDAPAQASGEETAVEAPAAPVDAPPAGEYRKVRIKPGKRGWGVGLEVKPEDGKNLIYSVTGGGIHPVAQRIADLTGGKPFDGFRSKADFHEIAVAVIDCGGTARIGVYPMKGVPTVDVHGASPSGPLMRFITEENFVSGVGIDDIEVIDG
jgi:PTS system glucitol/sorbitol-specific IIB component